MSGKIKLADLHEQWLRIADKGAENYSALTADERVWYNVQSLMEDVITGGLISNYYNEGGDHNSDLIEDLIKINCRDIAELILRLNNLFPGSEVPADTDERNEIIFSWDEDEHDELFDELDDLYFEKEEELEDKLVKFLIEKKLVHL